MAISAIGVKYDFFPTCTQSERKAVEETNLCEGVDLDSDANGVVKSFYSNPNIVVKIIPLGEINSCGKDGKRFIHDIETYALEQVEKARAKNIDGVQYIVRCMGSVTYDDGNVYFVFERELRDLSAYSAYRENPDNLEIEEVFTVANQVLQGLGALFASGIVYCDLKLRNILMHESCSPEDQRVYSFMICDMGAAIAFSTDQDLRKKVCAVCASDVFPNDCRGLLCTVATRSIHLSLLLDELYSSSPIWALGCIIFELLAKDLLFLQRIDGKYSRDYKNQDRELLVELDGLAQIYNILRLLRIQHDSKEVKALLNKSDPDYCNFVIFHDGEKVLIRPTNPSNLVDFTKFLYPEKDSLYDQGVKELLRTLTMQKRHRMSDREKFIVFFLSNIVNECFKINPFETTTVENLLEMFQWAERDILIFLKKQVKKQRCVIS